MVNPEHWDTKAGDLKKRVLINEEVRQKLIEDLAALKTYINKIACSNIARRTFIGNIYKLVQDPNLISALTGHVEGSRAFSRYRTIDMDMKKDLVKILEGKQ